MSRQLLVVRHAQATWDAAADLDRPLTPAGRIRARGLGEGLRQSGEIPDTVIYSPAARAYETAQAVIEGLGQPVPSACDERIYDAGLATLLAVLAAAPAVPRVLLVGHNPGCSDLIAYLTVAATDPRAPKVLMPPGALARMHMPDHWHDLHAGSAELLDMS